MKVHEVIVYLPDRITGYAVGEHGLTGKGVVSVITKVGVYEDAAIVNFENGEQSSFIGFPMIINGTV